jgi:predicted small metal-binding protein
MAKMIACECGVIVRGENDDELVQRAQAHALDVHRKQITREDALAMASLE